jgi:hypothetical protein
MSASNPSLAALCQIPATVSTLQLSIQHAIVNIRHEDRADIALMANYPGNWKIESGSVRQSRVQKSLGSGSMFGGGIVVDGNSVSIGGISIINGEVLVDGNSVSIGGISIINGEVLVDGKKSPGSDGSTSQGSSSGPDKLEVVVPNSFRGGLDLEYAHTSQVELDNWQGGTVSFSSRGSGKLHCGPLAGLSSFVLQSTGSGSIRIEAVETQSFTVTKVGSGDLDIDKLDTGALLLTQNGSGDTRVGGGTATSGSVSNTGSGNVSMRGRFGCISQRGLGSGKIEICVCN